MNILQEELLVPIYKIKFNEKTYIIKLQGVSKMYRHIFRGGRVHHRVQKFMGTHDLKRQEKGVADVEDYKRHKRVSNWICFIGHHEYHWLTG